VLLPYQVQLIGDASRSADGWRF